MPLYQSWHALAAMIAAAGLSVLRFDYHGTGDSLGDDREPGRVEAWRQSIRAAAQFMREECGFETLDLVGIRLGATLASLSAAEIRVERLVAIAPVANGRTYIREAQARSRMLCSIWRLGNASLTHGEIANDGFIITKETASDIARLDLTCVRTRPAREVLLVGETSSLIHKLQEAYETAGCHVTRKDFTGFAALMDSATLAQIPLKDWQAVVSYLTKARQAASNVPVLPRSFALQASSFHEERMIFGHDDRLAGVLCRPVAQTPVATILFLNTGGNPHFGWGRMSVEHARALAAPGVASLRLDIAGLGDAAPLAGSPRAALYRKESIADVREALELLEQRGLSNFTLVGHCSGAWLALNAGRADPRVRGLFLVNLQRFIWTGDEDLEALMAQAYRATDSYLQEIGSGAMWQRLLKGQINWARLPGIARAMLRRPAARIGNRLWRIAARLLGIETQTARISGMLRHLSERGTDTLLVYSETDPGREELARHFGASGCRLRLPRLWIATIENADHDITSEEARRAYFELLSKHVDCATGAIPAKPASERPQIVAQAA
ncbi:MAG: alpha/beta fold hydrolase [Methylobacteriaceae bacterium]|nr:alpha/beta fold hydrolase [Methylobacteriaceae bacterium]